MTRKDALRRLERANPCSADSGVAKTDWGRELLSAIVADEGTPTPSRPRRRRLGRRGVVLALAIALCVGAGGALAAITFDREAPPATQKQIRQALNLPAPDRSALTPVRGGIREAFRAETLYGTWVINTIQTKGKGDLISGGPIKGDGTLDDSGMGLGIGGCPKHALQANGVIGWCLSGANHPPGAAPSEPLYEIAGRTSPQVATVELTGADGQVIPGYVDGGFWLVLTQTLPSGDLHVVARDASGRQLADLSLEAVGGSPTPALPSRG